MEIVKETENIIGSNSAVLYGLPIAYQQGQIV